MREWILMALWHGFWTEFRIEACLNCGRPKLIQRAARARWLVLKLLAYCFLLTLWWALPWIFGYAGAIHSPFIAARFWGYTVYCLIGLIISKVLLGGWWKDWKAR